MPSSSAWGEVVASSAEGADAAAEVSDEAVERSEADEELGAQFDSLPQLRERSFIVKGVIALSALFAGFMVYEAYPAVSSSVRRALELREIWPQLEVCEEGDAQVCADFYYAARYHTIFGQFAMGDVFGAAERACELDELKCHALADAHMRGVGTATDPSKALKILERHCDTNVTRNTSYDVAKHCDYLARLHLYSDYGHQDVERTLEIAQPFCRATRSSESRREFCHLVIYAFRGGGGTPELMQEFRELFEARANRRVPVLGQEGYLIYRWMGEDLDRIEAGEVYVY